MEVTIHTIFSDVLDRSSGRESLVGKIAEWIGSSIIEGRLRPGDDLNSVALSHQFQTSRTPVREALMILEKEGLVTIPPRRRPYVAHVSLREVREIYRVRAHLYTLVSELIVVQAGGEAIQALWEQQARLEATAQVGDRDAYFWRNLSFRATEVEICGNTELRRTLDSLGLRTLHARHQSLTYPGRMERSVQDHARLVRAYEERDAPLAIALTRSLVLGGLAAIEATGWASERQLKEMDDADGADDQRRSRGAQAVPGH